MDFIVDLVSSSLNLVSQDLILDETENKKEMLKNQLFQKNNIVSVKIVTLSLIFSVRQ